MSGADQTLRARLALDTIETPLIIPLRDIEDREHAKEVCIFSMHEFIIEFYIYDLFFCDFRLGNV